LFGWRRPDFALPAGPAEPVSTILGDVMPG